MNEKVFYGLGEIARQRALFDAVQKQDEAAKTQAARIGELEKELADLKAAFDAHGRQIVAAFPGATQTQVDAKAGVIRISFGDAENHQLVFRLMTNQDGTKDFTRVIEQG